MGRDTSLGAFVASTLKNYFVAIFTKIDAITWTKINYEFMHPFSQRIAVSKVTLHNSIKPCPDNTPCLAVA